jgi:N-glycosylase/DNA lyase
VAVFSTPSKSLSAATCIEPAPEPSSSFDATAPKRTAALARQRGERGGGREANIRPVAPGCDCSFPVRDYDLDATLTSGQAFGWERSAESWIGVVNRRWVKLTQAGTVIRAQTAEPQTEWSWLADYLQPGVDLDRILATFPSDPDMRAAIESCRGLRLLRQDPWECLAAFILSSSKQIVQIRQIVAALGDRFGSPVVVPAGERPAFAFPPAQRLASATEAELRRCKMGFRAPYLLGTAQRIAAGQCDLAGLRQLPLAEARAQLLKLPGVGDKVADCVLLFAGGFPTAFPIDVWIAKALRKYYFRGRRVRPLRLRRYVARRFGPNAGYAQQYLFHYIRTLASDK